MMGSKLGKEYIKAVHCHLAYLMYMQSTSYKILRWMKLEPIIQSEVNQKEKHQYSILIHIYGIYKVGNNDPICETAKETQI